MNAQKGVEADLEVQAEAVVTLRGVTEDGILVAEALSEGDTQAPEAADQGVNEAMVAIGVDLQHEVETEEDLDPAPFHLAAEVSQAEADPVHLVTRGKERGVLLQKTLESRKKTGMKIKLVHQRKLVSPTVTLDKILRNRISFSKSLKTWLTRKPSDSSFFLPLKFLIHSNLFQ